MIDGAFRVKQGQVVFVNKIKWTCTVKFDDGTPTEHVAISPIYLNKGGNGIYFVPEVDSHVLVAFIDNKTFLLSVSYPVDMEKSVESAEDTNDSFDLEPDHSAQRPMFREGDVAITTSGGGFLQVAGSGLVEIGGSQISKRSYIPISNFIRDFCESYSLETFGGALSMITQEGNPSHGFETVNVKTDAANPDATPVPVTIQKSPVVFNLTLKEYAEDLNDMIKLSMGRIKAVGAPNAALPLSPGQDYDHTALIEFNVNDRFTFYLDKYGTVLQTIKGNVVQSYGSDLVQKVVGNKREVIKAGYSIDAGNFSLNSGGNMQSTVRGDKNTTILGNDSVQINKNRTETVRGVDSVVAGRLEQTSKGSMSTKVLGNSALSVGGKHSVSISDSHTALYSSGSKSDVLSGDFEVLCGTGNVKIRSAITGSATLTCFEASTVTLNATSAQIEYNTAGSGLEANAKGVGLFSAGGGVSIDTNGVAKIGSKVGAVGAVITTATNPVCFVTGLPLLGASNVIVTSSAPAPTPAASIYTRTP